MGVEEGVYLLPCRCFLKVPESVFYFLLICCIHYVQEIGLHGKGDIKVRDTSFAYKELRGTRHLHKAQKSKVHIYGATQFNTRTLTLE